MSMLLSGFEAVLCPLSEEILSGAEVLSSAFCMSCFENAVKIQL